MTDLLHLRRIHVSLLAFCLSAGAFAAACSSDNQDTSTSSTGSSTSSNTSGAGGAGGMSSSSGQGGNILVGVGGSFGQGGAGGGSNCVPPDMLIVLDRTMSMHRRPDGTVPPDTAAGHMESKWYLAITAVETLAATLDKKIRFGLELFPLDPGQNKCVTLSQRISGITATNTACEAGEVLVQPALSTGGAIANLLDPETTRLCTSTPLGAGLTTARQALSAIQMPDRPQFALVISDGGETCDQSLPLSEVQQLSSAGVKTYVVAFDGAGGVNEPLMNDLACAGKTSPGFPANCLDDGNGNYHWDSASMTNVFLKAENETALNDALKKVGADICCDCVPN